MIGWIAVIVLVILIVEVIYEKWKRKQTQYGMW